jgi:thiol-disulfide isomerase/thioredoxin
MSIIRIFFVTAALATASALIMAGFRLGCTDKIDGLESQKNAMTSKALVAPSYQLDKPDGKKFSSDEMSGKIHLVHFWASWCAPCLEEIAFLLDYALEAEVGKVPLHFVLISLDEKWSDAMKIIGKRKIPNNTVLLIDPSLKTAEKFGSFQYPESYLLHKDQKIVMKWVGPQNWKNGMILNFLKILNSDPK